MTGDKSQKQLGVCYYPEHWPEDLWAQDAAEMKQTGISIVRIGEFAWSRLEPSRGDYQFNWLQKAMDVLHEAGLQVVLGTPTATPPKWLVDEMPDMLPVDREGKVKRFGSRRHYSFSHEGYRDECRRIVTELARKFGNHPALIAWQTDNEYGCHDTAYSFSAIDLHAFQNWLARKYQSPHALNTAWGNVFWSMEISDFNQIELPNLTVADANPAHWMDYCRFTSDMIAEFNTIQTKIIRKHSPGRDVLHNFMGRTLEFDHFDVGKDLDISTWDSYPLGFLEDRINLPETEKQRLFRAGDPDFQAFHHDLYRATSGGRWWIMEQQPGPVNWAPYNPFPRNGMVRLWSLEAFAHGAEVVSYFRWRQAPFAQEQMHSGLKRPDNSFDVASHEAREVMDDLEHLGELTTIGAEVAILFDYQAAWAWSIQPQGADFDYFGLVFDFYRALRKLGVSIDFMNASDPDLSGYKFVIAPGIFSWSEKCVDAIKNFDGEILIGPRSGSKTQDFSVPPNLPPDLPATLLDLRVLRVETIRPAANIEIDGNGSFVRWFEHVECGTSAEPVLETAEGLPAMVTQNNISYLSGWPDEKLISSIMEQLLTKCEIQTVNLPFGVRTRQSGNLHFVFNYGDHPVALEQYFNAVNLVIGDMLLDPSGVSVIRANP